MNLAPCDIIAVKGSTLLSRLICDFSGPISHVGMVTSVNPVLVTQALSTIETISLDTMLAQDAYGYVLQPLKLRVDQQEAIVKYVLSHVGEAYDYADLGYQALDKLSGSTFFTSRFASKSRVICSELVARGYAQAGLTFGISSRSATPTEIFEYALQHPDQYAIITLKGEVK